MLRFHGSRDKVTYEHVGYNSRLDELQAAILRVQLPELDGWADGRRGRRRAYERGRPRRARDAARAPRRGAEPAWHLYVVAQRGRRRARRARSRPPGIGQKAYYRIPLHRQPAMRELGAGVELPATDELARTHLAIPMSPVLTAEQAARSPPRSRTACGPGERLDCPAHD